MRNRNRDWLRRWDATSPAGVSGPRSFGEMVSTYRRQARAGQTLPFMVVVEGQLAGQVTVNNIVRGSGQFASIGYWIDEAYAGRGLTTQAVAMVIDHCFYAARLHRVEVAIRPENAASLRVVEKLGIKEYGYAPRYLHIDGDWRDHRLFAVTVEEVPGGMVRRLQKARPQ
ncbi:GNAT family N-acetyltransferase [Marmoricola endophyticus]|uniref:GNAT family N-acetyltransferase n=1 Tax=Marmoricola endophyticus TaxID=2040280 RepID=UPI0035711D13